MRCSRDRALDTYERVLQKNLEDLRAQKDSENAQLEDEINQRVAELRAARSTRTRPRSTASRRSCEAWRARKRQEENRIAEAVGYFVSENPITTVRPCRTDK